MSKKNTIPKQLVKPESNIVSHPENKYHVVNGREFSLADRHILNYHVFVPAGVEIESLLNEAAWQHVAYQLQPNCRIHVTSDDGKYIAQLLVISCGPQWAKVEIIFYKELNEGVHAESNPDFEVAYVGHMHKWGVRRRSDNYWVSKDLPTVADANQAMLNHMKMARHS